MWRGGEGGEGGEGDLFRSNPTVMKSFLICESGGGDATALILQS